MGVVYFILCFQKNKQTVYIGSTKKLVEERFQEHCSKNNKKSYTAKQDKLELITYIKCADPFCYKLEKFMKKHRSLVTHLCFNNILFIENFNLMLTGKTIKKFKISIQHLITFLHENNETIQFVFSN